MPSGLGSFGEVLDGTSVSLTFTSKATRLFSLSVQLCFGYHIYSCILSSLLKMLLITLKSFRLFRVVLPSLSLISFAHFLWYDGPRIRMWSSLRTIILPTRVFLWLMSEKKDKELEA